MIILLGVKPCLCLIGFELVISKHYIIKWMHNFMTNKTGFLILLFIFATQNLWAADSISKGDLLTLEQCITIALKNHPALSAAGSRIRASESVIGQVRAGFYPQITLHSGYSRVGPAPAAIRNDPYHYYANTLSLDQTLFDFGRTWTQVDIATLNKESVQADAADVKASVIFGVKEAFYSFLKAQKSEKVALETVTQFQQHYEKAAIFFETGKTSKIDVTSAEVNLSNAKINLIRASNALRIAKVNLNHAMGVNTPPDYNIRDDLSEDTAPVSLGSAVSEAYLRRPDMISLARKKESLEKTIDLSKKGYLPVLSGNAAYGFTGDELSAETRNWSVGVSLTFPLFTGLSTKYVIDEARANLDIIKADEELLRQKIYLEVESAYLYVHEFSERINAAKMIVRQAEETLELAKGRYATGVGSSLEITDALITVNNAKMTYITALTDYFTSRANLDRATGVSP